MVDKADLPATGFLVTSEAPNECKVVRYWRDPDLFYQASALDEGDQSPSTDADPVLAKVPPSFNQEFSGLQFFVVKDVTDRSILLVSNITTLSVTHQFVPKRLTIGRSGRSRPSLSIHLQCSGWASSE